MTGRQEPRRMFRYTTDSYLTVDPALAQAIGLDGAIVLTRISYLLHLSKGKEGHADGNGTTWVWNSYDEWRRDHFPFFTKSHVIEVIRRLEREGLLVSRQRTSHDRRKLYTIDYAAVDDCVRKATFPMAGEPAPSQDGLTADAAPQTGHGTTSADAESHGQSGPTAATPQAGHGATSADAERLGRRPSETKAMNARNSSLQARESKPPSEENPRLQGRDTPRCYRDTTQQNIHQTIHQNRQQEALSTRQRLLGSFKVSERVTGYV